MKRNNILIFILHILTFPMFCQENPNSTGKIYQRYFTLSAGTSKPISDFAATAPDIGPYGNAKTGFYLSGALELDYKLLAWKFETMLEVNPLDTNELLVIELYPKAEIGNWMNLKLLTGPQFKINLKKVTINPGLMAGCMWLYHPNINYSSPDASNQHKIQYEGQMNFAWQINTDIYYRLSENTSIGLTFKYFNSNAQAKYLETSQSYQLGNVYYEEPDPTTVRYARMNNQPPIEDDPYAGWVGTQRRDGSIKQKVTTMSIGVTLRKRF